MAFEFPKNIDPAALPPTMIGPNWAVRLLPYIEQASVYGLIDQTALAIGTWPGKAPPAIGHVNNAAVRTTVLSVFRCPSDTNYSDTIMRFSAAAAATEWARGNYAANAGNGPLFNRSGDGIFGPQSDGWLDGRRRGVIGPNVGAKLKGITDGTSNTLMLGEVRGDYRSRSTRELGARSGWGERVVLVRPDG